MSSLSKPALPSTSAAASAPLPTPPPVGASEPRVKMEPGTSRRATAADAIVVSDSDDDEAKNEEEESESDSDGPAPSSDGLISFGMEREDDVVREEKPKGRTPSCRVANLKDPFPFTPEHDSYETLNPQSIRSMITDLNETYAETMELVAKQKKRVDALDARVETVREQVCDDFSSILSGDAEFRSGFVFNETALKMLKDFPEVDKYVGPLGELKRWTRKSLVCDAIAGIFGHLPWSRPAAHLSGESAITNAFFGPALRAIWDYLVAPPLFWDLNNPDPADAIYSLVRLTVEDPSTGEFVPSAGGWLGCDKVVLLPTAKQRLAEIEWEKSILEMDTMIAECDDAQSRVEILTSYQGMLDNDAVLTRQMAANGSEAQLAARTNAIQAIKNARPDVVFKTDTQWKAYHKKACADVDHARLRLQSIDRKIAQLDAEVKLITRYMRMGYFHDTRPDKPLTKFKQFEYGKHGVVGDKPSKDKQEVGEWTHLKNCIDDMATREAQFLDEIDRAALLSDKKVEEPPTLTATRAVVTARFTSKGKQMTPLDEAFAKARKSIKSKVSEVLEEGRRKRRITVDSDEEEEQRPRGGKRIRAVTSPVAEISDPPIVGLLSGSWAAEYHPSASPLRLPKGLLSQSSSSSSSAAAAAAAAAPLFSDSIEFL
jgi:hypothetical protein